jgi:4-hydroxy-2-oxoheptanedioate aldolase
LGFDFLCIESEHTAVNPGALVDLVRAADLAGLPTLVRVADNSDAGIAQALDAGANGILVPHVESQAEAIAIVSASRFPPLGIRGAGPGRAALYGREIGGYIAAANESTLVGIQIETDEGVRQMARILEVEGIDLIFIGPTDLAVSLGHLGDPQHHEVRQVIDRIVEDSIAGGRFVGIFAANAQAAFHWIAKGCRVILLASDLIFMTTAAAAAATELRAELGSH